ncbi:receptor-transporting protein 3-like [Garra rufa]|uniref:receptor-transporting protein 3-like n=1 Tax=Garra rufa TaxID=137080 RepID=UPI003CCE6FF5
MASVLWESSLQTKASELHEDPWQIIINDSIKPHSQASGWHQYISGSFARFKCSLCKRTWPSKRVHVVFHFHLNTETKQGTIKLRRYKQNCRKCNEAQMEDPHFLEDNINVLIQRLVDRIRMKCYGENLGETNKPSVFRGRVNGPHERAHCEACKDGICNQAN